MGRAPCCEKVGLKRGRWTAEEDEILSKYIQEHGEGSWRSLPKNAGLLRCGKSCRLRWINYLRSDLKRGNITPEEEDAIIKLHTTLGNRWSVIAGHLAGRTDNEIKNYWNSHLSRKIGIPRTPINTSPVNMVMEVAKAAESSKRRKAGGRPSMRMKNENRPVIAQKISMPEPKEVEIISNVTAPLMPTTPTSEKETTLSNAISWTEENLSTIFAEPCEAQEHSNQVMAAYEMCFDEILCNWEPSENPGQAYHSSPAVSRSIDWDWNFDATENGGGGGGGSDTGGEKDDGGMLSWLWDGDSWEGECNTGGVDQTVDSKKQSAMVAWLLS